MPKQIQEPGVGQELTRLFGLLGRVRPALDEVIVPVVQVAELGQGSPPGRTNAFALWVSIAAGAAGEFSYLRMDVPAGTVVQLLRVRVDTSVYCYVGETYGAGVGATAVSRVTSYDSRGNQASSVSPTADANNSAGGGGMRLDSGTYDVSDLGIYAGGMNSRRVLAFAAVSAATPINISVSWREWVGVRTLP